MLFHLLVPDGTSLAWWTCLECDRFEVMSRLETMFDGHYIAGKSIWTCSYMDDNPKMKMYLKKKNDVNQYRNMIYGINNKAPQKKIVTCGVDHDILMYFYRGIRIPSQKLIHSQKNVIERQTASK